MEKISFGSAYRVYITPNKIKKFNKPDNELADYLRQNDIEYKKSRMYSENAKSRNDDHVVRYEVVTPKSKDEEFEVFCANRGIDFCKKDAPKVSDIKRRISKAPEGYQTAFINVEKFDNLLKKNHSNMNFLKYLYNENIDSWRDKTETLIKSDKKLNLPQLKIKSMCAYNNVSAEQFKEQVKTKGIEKMSEGLSFTLDDNITYDIRSDFGFLALKQEGMNEIPVLMDKESYQKTEVLGLLTK